MKNYIFFYVNGEEIIDYDIEPEWTLLWYLRNKLRLTGTKSGCGEGGCGACTVTVSRCIDKESNEIEYRTINSCLASICSVDGCHVITIEGIGSLNKSNLHPTQIRFAELYGSQCGFCTPGMIMSLYGTLTSKDNLSLTLKDIEESFDGNLCRCTGYRPILDIAKTFANDIENIHYDKSSSSSSSLIKSTTYDKCSSYVQENSLPIKQIEFPSKLRDYIPQSIHIKGNSIEWYRPISLDEVLELRHTYPGNQSKFVFGNTTVQIERKFQHIYYPRLISITHIKELQEIKRTKEFIYIGAGVTFTQLKLKLIQWNNEYNNNNEDGGFCQSLLNQINQFASTHIRNVASIGGNIIAASPISDINPVLEAAGTILELHCIDRNKIRYIPLYDLYLGDHRISIKDNEILINIHIPLPKSLKNKYFLQSYKQARRRDDSKGIVSAGFHVELEQININNNQWKIVSVCFSFSGMSSKTIIPINTQQKLIGLSWTKETINQACELLLKEMPLNELSPGGLIQYRRTLVQSFLFKFYSYVCNELQKSLIDSSILPYHRPISHGQQIIPEKPQSQNIVGTSLPHRSAYLHTTGDAIYLDDMPSLINTLHAALVLSTKPNAKILHIDIEAASKVPGFVSFVSHIDVPGSNIPNDRLPDEEVFVSSIALCIGAVIGVVVCKTEDAAQKASNLIKIDYEVLSPLILTIEDAINYQSFFGEEINICRGDVKKSFLDSEHILEETLFMGGQEHFYMETNCCMVIPSDDDKEVTLYSGTQSPSATQELTALVLGRDVSHITCHVKRVGGGFGGKETRSIPPCLAIAVAAVKVNRPVRLNLERQIDIAVTGHRHPFKIKYKVAFNNEGHIQGLDMQFFNNAGSTLDASDVIMEKALLHMCNAYQIPNVEIRGRVCKTHLPSNTAFRGFGAPQAIFATETVIEHIATYLKCDPYRIRNINLFKEGDRTHYGQVLEGWNIPRIVDELSKSSDFFQRQINVNEFNQKNIYRKRGISLIPVKFGIGYPLRHLNQAGALVHIYKDGSVLISHGGVEIGQGLHTKMISIAAEALRCNIDKVRISETATDKVHNTVSTAASVSSDLNGMAVKRACEQLRQRLDKLINEKNLDISWEDLIKQAYLARIDLCEHGFYATPNMFDVDFDRNRAHFNYFTQGAAVTEVELDVLTGDWHILRVDILMDVGISLNPQLDIGQIEGGFMQGIGLFTMEELIWGDDKQNKWIEKGKLFTCGPDTYKIPSFSDVPIDFRVSLLSNSTNPRAVYSSKGIGEPPLLLGTSVFFALKQACMAYRKEHGLSDYFTFHSPATVERLRMICVDEFTHRACSDEYEIFPPRGSY